MKEGIKYTSDGIEDEPKELNIYEQIAIQRHCSVLETGVDPNTIVMHELDAELLLEMHKKLCTKPLKSVNGGLFKYAGMDVVRTMDIDRGKFLFCKRFKP